MNPPSVQLIEEVRVLLRAAAAHWRASLIDSRLAVSYLRERGIGGAVASRFGLGYASGHSRDLGRVFEGFTEAAIDASGLLCDAAFPAQGQVRFDRFRYRVMFPINTADGAPAGFGGRRLLDSGRGEPGPKYLNSPEGPLFSKRALLYGLHQAAPAIRSSGSALVTEGYFDVIALAQNGQDNAVATLGTACGHQQVEQLLGLTNRIVFCFDGDEAGRAAAGRALAACAPFLTDERHFDFVTLPSGHDPDSFVREQGIDAFRCVARQGVQFLWFLLGVLASDCSPRELEGRVRIAARAAPFYRTMPDSAARDDLLDYCATLLREPREALAARWSGTYAD